MAKNKEQLEAEVEAGLKRIQTLEEQNSQLAELLKNQNPSDEALLEELELKKDKIAELESELADLRSLGVKKAPAKKAVAIVNGRSLKKDSIYIEGVGLVTKETFNEEHYELLGEQVERYTVPA